MSKELLRPVYAAHVGTKFRARLEEAHMLELELIEVNEIPSPPTQEQFSLIFCGPVDAPLQQRTYELDHDELESSALLLVPVGSTPAGLFYEAFFNRLLR
jgi:hypothetical protein